MNESNIDGADSSSNSSVERSGADDGWRRDVSSEVLGESDDAITGPDPVAGRSTGAAEGIDAGTPATDAVGPSNTADEAVEAKRHPSEMADRRADLWHLQGENDQGFRGTCGIASSAEMLSDLREQPISERELVAHAADNGLCVTETQQDEPAELGGTSLEGIRQLHLDAGVESSVESRMSQADLARSIEQGDGVIAAVNSAEVWPAEYREPGDQPLPGTDHAIWMTGVSRDDQGTITGFYANDTGIPDGAGRFISSDEVGRGWEERGGQAVVARRPS